MCKTLRSKTFANFVFIISSSFTFLFAFPRFAAYTLNMTSQRWLTDADFSSNSEGGSVWWHYLVVIVPENLQYTRNGTIWITGMGQHSVPDSGNEDVILSAALATNVGLVTGVLFQVRFFIF